MYAQDNPLQPSGFRPPPPKQYDLGAPDPSLEDTERIYWKRFGSIKVVGSKVTASDGVEFQYRGYTVRANEAAGDTETEQFTLRGEVTLRGVDQVVTGHEVWVDFRERTYRFLDGSADFRPSFFDGRLLSNLYGAAERSEGGEKHVVLDGGSITTCSLDHPHFHLGARAIEVTPGDRAILRDVRISALDRTLLTLPHFVLPLDRPNYNGYLPDVGRSQFEGVYVKSRFDANLLGKQRATVRAEAMEKRGLGLGLGQVWKYAAGEGGYNVYNLYDQQRGQNTLTGDFTHNERIGKLGFSSRLGISRNIYANFPETRRLDGSIGLRYGSSSLDYRDSRNDSGDYSSGNRTIALADNRRLGGGFSATSRIAYTNFETQRAGVTLSQREQADVNLGLRYAARTFDADLTYQRLVPIGGTTTYRTSFERTPVLTLRSDTSRLLGWRSEPRVALEASVGEYVDGFRNVRVVREGFGARASQSTKTGKGLSFGYSSEFAQSFHSDGTAQYVLNQTIESRYGLSSGERAQGIILRYRYTRPYGYSPLSFDRRGETNIATALLEIPFAGGLTFRAGGGYDLLQEKRGQVAWNTIGAALRYRPSDDFFALVTSSYDPREQLWSTTRLACAWRLGETTLQAEARYDGRLERWGNANFRLEGLRLGRLKTSLLLLYNGYLKQFDTQQFQLTYDLHCAEAVIGYRNTLTGYRRGQDFQFAIRLKALPYRSDFGLGVSGEPLDTSTGVDF